jgi:quinol monooxygenase YgiN
MSVSLLVLIETQPGKSAEQLKAFEQLAPKVRAEAGCLEYQLHRVSGREEQFVLTETWESEAALGAHDIAAHMVEADAANKAFRAGPATVLRLTKV